MFEDQVFFAKLLLRFPVFVSDRCWAKYRQHDRSSSAMSAAAGDDDARRTCATCAGCDAISPELRRTRWPLAWRSSYSLLRCEVAVDWSWDSGGAAPASRSGAWVDDDEGLVVVPFLNAGPFLAEAIASVQAQT